jgi:hypothetical protein
LSARTKKEERPPYIPISFFQERKPKTPVLGENKTLVRKSSEKIPSQQKGTHEEL